MNKSEYPTSKKQPNLRYCGPHSGKARELNEKLSYKAPSLTWTVKKRGHVGEITKLHPPKSSLGLSPGERWISFGSDNNVLFPLESAKPEVYKMRLTMPKQLPRKVMIDRMRLEYLKTDVNQIIAKRNIDPITLIPPEIVCADPAYGQDYTFDRYVSRIPLDIFDNEDLECMTSEKWMTKSIVNNTSYSLPATAFVPAPGRATKSTVKDIRNTYVWTPVAVTGFNKHTNRWSVVTLDQYKSAYELPRIYIFFKAENPTMFEQRLVDALEYRAEVEMELRLQLYVDAMVVTGVPEMSKQMVNKINQFLNCKYIERFMDRIEEMKKDLALDYKRALCQMELRTLAIDKFSRFFPKPIKKSKMYVIKITPRSEEEDYFKITLDYYRWVNIFIIINTFQAVRSIVIDGLKVEQMTLFSNIIYRRGIPLDDFKHTEHEHIKRTVRFLSDVWVKMCTASIKTQLLATGKNWFDVYECHWDIYVVSKLCRLMELVRFRMQGNLYELVMSSIKKYSDYLVAPCQVTLRCKKIRNLLWGNDLINSVYVSPTAPVYIFTLTLSLNQTCAFYSTPPEQFLTTLLELFDEAIVKCHFINQVQPYVLENLRFPPNLFLSSVGLLNPIVQKKKDKITEAYTCAIMPLKAYLREWNQYVPLFSMVVSEYIKALREENRSSTLIRNEISYHLNDQARMERSLPFDIIIGPFLIKTHVIRLFLINKRFEVAHKIMDMYADCLADRVAAVNTIYFGIMTKLLEKTQSIEHIFAIREWMMTISPIVEKQRSILEEILHDYEILDVFYYALSDEDFVNKFNSVCFPMKIFDQIELTNIVLEEDTDKYFRLQQNDEMNLDDRIEVMSGQVVSYGLVNDVNKIVDIAVEVRRLNKQMSEAVALSKVLQKRQVLFEMPVRPYEDLYELKEKFHPFVVLWGTASDAVRGLEGWLWNPVFNLDLELLYANMATYLEAIEQSIVNFQDMPIVQSVAFYVKKLLLDFKPIAILARAVRNPDMHEEHWLKVQEMTGIKFEINPVVTTLKHIRDLKPHKYAEQIAEMSATVTREFKLAEALRLKESHERFFKSLLHESIVADMKMIYRKGLFEYVDEIIEDMMVNAEDSMFVIDVTREIVERANVITYRNIASHITEVIDHMLIKKLHLH